MSRIVASSAFCTVKYSMYDGPTRKATSAKMMITIVVNRKPVIDRPRSLRRTVPPSLARLTPSVATARPKPPTRPSGAAGTASVGAVHPQWIVLPTRLNDNDAMSSQLNQMKKALPRRWSSGTNPQ